MLELKDQSRLRQTYRFERPGVNLQTDRAVVPPDQLVESIGTDGRFSGAIRPFPGMANVTVHGIPVTGTDLPNGFSTDVLYAKYVSLQKGLSQHVLRGVVYIAAVPTSHTIGASTGYSWQVSSVGAGSPPLQYFCHVSGDTTNPNYQKEPDSVTYGGVALTRDDAALVTGSGTPGLTHLQWGWGNANGERTTARPGASDNTIYVNIGADPDGVEIPIAANHTGYGVYFAYYDSETDTSDLILLEDLTQVYEAPNTLTDWDVSCNGRYIYVVGYGSNPDDPTKTWKYNRAFWYDFAYTSWQKTQNQIEGRWMGIFRGQTPTEYDTFTASTLNDVLATSEPVAGTLSALGRRFGVELLSYKHKLRSKLAAVLRKPLADKTVRVSASNFRMPIYTSGGVKYFHGNTYDLGTAYWGLHTWDAVRLWRTIGQDSTSSPENFDLMGTFFIEGEVSAQEYGLSNDGSTKFDSDGSDLDNNSLELDSGETIDDVALARTINSYNAFLYEVGEMPMTKRITAVPGLTVIGTVANRVNVDPEIGWFYEGQLPEAIRWSSVQTGEIENFPTTNVYHPKPGEVIHQITSAGDHVFVVTNNAVHRITRTGSLVGVTTLHENVGGVSRYAAVGVGDNLYILTRSGFKVIDGNTGGIHDLSIVDRQIFDERSWGDSLEAVRVEYDAYAGCLILLNTTQKEMVLLWEASGEVTTVVDCPWSFVTGGPDPTTGGNRRALFVTTQGMVNCIDANREMAQRSMCGAEAGDTTLGTAAGTSTSLFIDLESGTFPTYLLEGFYIYFLTGNLAGQKVRVITRHPSNSKIGVEGMGMAPAAGDKFSIAPVYTRVTCPQFGNYDLFTRKKVRSISAALSNVDASVGATAKLGVWRRSQRQSGVEINLEDVPDRATARVLDHATQLYPYFECYWPDADYELQGLLVHGELSGSEAESRMAVTT